MTVARQKLKIKVKVKGKGYQGNGKEIGLSDLDQEFFSCFMSAAGDQVGLRVRRNERSPVKYMPSYFVSEVLPCWGVSFPPKLCPILFIYLYSTQIRLGLEKGSAVGSSRHQRGPGDEPRVHIL